ncbi:UDP-N-acetylmuramoyl-L-alanine--D-glutamate ligase [Simkania negevensis]|uniref:UDP-N-acetylmuramoylalanine--D-glutamate ligase n=1 Tax=Simkania negevensis TaxID=83561 RepID=A0ABS3ARC2_9BACT|nr:UDP-N-acetylmuramoyl-L-alanine--D-glutamate ligase [Simkania negevensis]
MADYRKVLVVGLGVSGLAAAKLLLDLGAAVVGYDQAPLPAALPPEMTLVAAVDAVDWNELDCLVTSPGVAPSHPFIVQARARGLEIIGEVELALRHLYNPSIGITGTNGKTTVTMLTAHVLNSCGRPAHAVGNVGDPLSTYVGMPANDILVVELSSYQLETLTTPAFDAAALLNITPDHLDRYKDMEEYARAKASLQHCMKDSANFFVEEVAAVAWRELFALPPKTFGFSQKADYSFAQESSCRGKNIEYNIPERYKNLREIDRANALASLLLCHTVGVEVEEFWRAYASFVKPPYRLERVAEHNGVAFIDDSKGTNVDAVVKAVESVEGPIVLIAGGVDKGSSYTVWKEAFKGRVKAVCSIGEAAEKIAKELGDDFDVRMMEKMDDAVVQAYLLAQPKGSVLLSPGCSSFDMFRNYAHRGDVFKDLVREIIQRS